MPKDKDKPKERASEYDKKLKIVGSLDDVLKASAKPKEKK
jgi:hypothetical protein